MVMSETRLSAMLPQLDVEIVRREDVDPDEQMLIVRLRAKPSFQAVAEHLAGRGLPLAAALLPSPADWWANWLRAAWLPWQAAAAMMAIVGLPAREAEPCRRD
jgi:hypothetical protein